MKILKGVNLSKSYREKKVLSNLNFSVEPGTVYGILGPNGAGKTTLIRILTRLLLADSGEVFYEDQKLSKKHIASIGYMPEEKGLYKNMKVGEQLMYFAKLHGIDDDKGKRIIADWLNRLDMADVYKKRISVLSKGMSQKIQFIATIIHNPKLLILDEPFSGLDPVSSKQIENEIEKLKKEGTTIILSTHRMDQIEHLCDKILLINKGGQTLEGDVKNLKNQFKRNLFRIEFKEDISHVLFPEYEIKERSENSLVLKSLNISSTNKLLHDLLSKNIEIESFQELLPTMQEIFIQVTSEKEKTSIL